jgi:hypothetical protein
MADAEQSDLKWEKAGTSLEIRTQGTSPNGKPVLDEVVASGATVHLEQMDDNQWWIGIQAGGRDFHLWFSLEDGRLCVRLSDQDDEEALWEGDNREKPLPGMADSSGGEFERD